MRLWCVLAVWLAGQLVTPRGAHADDWPQFRGPNCTGISTEPQSLPVKFSADENLKWQVDAGDGIGGAVVAAGRVFVSGMLNDHTVQLQALDASTGAELWKRTWETGPLAEIHSTNSQASATPAADDKHVYFYFTTLGLRALDAASGRDVWHQQLPTPFFVFKWGPGMSPVLHKDLVLFCQDDDLNPALYAFDKTSGRLRWKDERRDMAVNYSHPVSVNVGGHDEIVVAGTGRVIGYDPQSGKRLWWAQVLLRNIKTTPVIAGDVIYISVMSSAIASQWLAAIDRDEKAGNNDNRVDKAEIERYVGKQAALDDFLSKTFDKGDENHDGFLEGAELDRAFLDSNNFAGADYRTTGDAAAEQFIMAVRAGGSGDVTKSHLLWKHKTKSTDHIVSPLLSDKRMFLIKDGGICTVFQTQDGLPARAPSRAGNGGSYYASPVVGDGKIYLASTNGKVTVLKNDETYQGLAINDLGEFIGGTPAIASGKLYIRTRTKLMCFVL